MTTLCINDHIEEMEGDALEKALAFLPSWRREKALAYRHVAGQRQCALAYVELCRALALRGCAAVKPHFAYNAHGKPLLEECPGTHFSISHCRQAVGCVVDDMPCGLDIESIRPLNPSLVRRVMNAAEAERIFSSLAPEVEFACLWTCKEAVFKLLGTGITDDLPHILTRAQDDRILLDTVCNPARGYVFSTARRPG